MTAVYLALISLACYSSKRILQRLNTPAAFTNFIGLAFYRENTRLNYTRQLSLILLALRFIEKLR